jgi:hypothetical protein
MEKAVVDFGKVFDLLKRAKYSHESDNAFEACFRNWEVFGGTVEEAVAAVIRLALFELVIDVADRLCDRERDQKDVLIFLIVKVLGMDKISQVVEIVERGLERLYQEESFETFEECMKTILEWLVGKFGSSSPEKEVMVQ